MLRPGIVCGPLQGMAALQATFSETNESELASFTSYALAFPAQFQALVDTYDVRPPAPPSALPPCCCPVVCDTNASGQTAL